MIVLLGGLDCYCTMSKNCARPLYGVSGKDKPKEVFGRNNDYPKSISDAQPDMSLDDDDLIDLETTEQNQQELGWKDIYPKISPEAIGHELG